MLKMLCVGGLIALGSIGVHAQRISSVIDSDWKFKLNDSSQAQSEGYDDSSRRRLNLPHDWSAEAEFSKEHSGSNAWLPGGIGNRLPFR